MKFFMYIKKLFFVENTTDTEFNKDNDVFNLNPIVNSFQTEIKNEKNMLRSNPDLQSHISNVQGISNDDVDNYLKCVFFTIYPE
ncbi:hypothetical protein COBT_003452 [Conglomerata obtusa]